MQISSAPYANICRYVCIYMYAYMHTQKNHTYTSWVDTESCNGRKRLKLTIITKKSYFSCSSWVDTESCNGHNSSHQSAHLAGHLKKNYIKRGPSVRMYNCMGRGEKKGKKPPWPCRKFAAPGRHSDHGPISARSQMSVS